LDIKNVGLAILVGAVVTCLLSFLLWIFAPFIGALIAGFLYNNGSTNRRYSYYDYNPAWVGLLSAILGVFIFLIVLHLFFETPPTEGRGDWEFGVFAIRITLLFGGLFLGYFGGALGGFARNMVKGKPPEILV
jgi:MFS family permease